MFHSGDLAIEHPDGYIEVNDRLKDNIIYGGENISTVEVEKALYSHPAVTEAAVVARPDNHWGQTPCAFAKLKEGSDVRPQETINFCRDNLPHCMAPRTRLKRYRNFYLGRKQKPWAVCSEQNEEATWLASLKGHSILLVENGIIRK
ncbi:putative acyl-activating enzyme 1, peroxisomal [Capsicum baccatum]|uniref:Acyl-activating enzyme 1, peroxisomal n=1 Tax=Capsicum baccatum TaxID=33114 RepID=A0A2G2XC67_CAPBA|nr:putative acyl-activating enzyme 1, peroxisomal [Capsicum baccatum]